MFELFIASLLQFATLTGNAPINHTTGTAPTTQIGGSGWDVDAIGGSGWDVDAIGGSGWDVDAIGGSGWDVDATANTSDSE